MSASSYEFIVVYRLKRSLNVARILPLISQTTKTSLQPSDPFKIQYKTTLASTSIINE